MNWDPWIGWSSSIWVHGEYMNAIPKMPKAMMEDSIAATGTTITKKLHYLVNLWYCDVPFYSLVCSFLALKEKTLALKLVVEVGVKGGVMISWLLRSHSHILVSMEEWEHICDVVKTTKLSVSKEVKPLLRTLSSDLYSPTFTSHTKMNFYQRRKIYDISVCSQSI